MLFVTADTIQRYMCMQINQMRVDLAKFAQM